MPGLNCVSIIYESNFDDGCLLPSSPNSAIEAHSELLEAKGYFIVSFIKTVSDRILRGQ